MSIRTIEQSPLYSIANPRSIAVFGASTNIDRMGTIILDSMMVSGYRGTVYPVHPQAQEILGFKAYRRVADLPEVPDLALLVLPTSIVTQTLEACGKKGIRHAIVVSGGFRESGAEGARQEKQLQKIARKYGIRFLGPNCLGVANPHWKLNPTPFQLEGGPGFIGLASQSGSFVTQMFNYLAGFNLGFSTAFSVGNEANIDLVDCMEYLGACPHTRVIALYIEGIRRGRQFVEAARRISQHKPIVALYVGGSETGRRAGFSHTGSLAGPDRLYDGMFRQAGVMRAASLTELFDISWALGALPPIRGKQVVLLTHSGGPGATAADACGRSGFDLPALSPQTVERLKPYIPPTASISNPVDLTFSKNPASYLYEIPKVLLEEPRADVVMGYLIEPAVMFKRALRLMGMSVEQASEEADKVAADCRRKLSDLVRGSTKPFVGYTFRTLSEPFVQGLIQSGVPVFPDPLRAIRAIDAVVQYYRNLEKLTRAA